MADNTSVIYVKKGATGNGASWKNACGNLQEAIKNAEDGAEIWVAKGTYTGEKPGSLTDEFSAVFNIIDKDIKLYGSFAGTEMHPDERILSGENATILDGKGSRVLYAKGLSYISLIDGFTITGGNETEGSIKCGGGIAVRTASLNIRNVIISGNRAYYGGGIYIRNDDIDVGVQPHIVTLYNVVISGNRATLGYGMYNSKSSGVELYNVTISGNAGINNVGSNTGSVYNLQCSPKINNTIIWGNYLGVYNTANIPADTKYPSYSNCLVQGLNSNSNNNISASSVKTEIFRNPIDHSKAPTTEGDYHLRHGSPVIDKGDSLWIRDYPPLVDLDGSWRAVGETVDMGAYEYVEIRIDVHIDGIDGDVSEGLEIKLYKSDGTPVEIVANKDNRGFYFNNVTPGTYIVSAKAPGYLLSYNYNSQIPTEISSWKDATLIRVAAYNATPEIGFGERVKLIPEPAFEKPGTVTISGRVSELTIVKANQTRNVNVKLLSNENLESEDEFDLVRTTTTDDDGDYTFSDLPGDCDYQLAVDLPGFESEAINIPATDGNTYPNNNFEINIEDKTVKADGPILAAPFQEEVKLRVYPNPATDVVRIEGLEGAYTIKVINILGQVVYSVKGSSHELTLNVSSLTSGMYFLCIESFQKVTTRKIIIKQ